RAGARDAAEREGDGARLPGQVGTVGRAAAGLVDGALEDPGVLDEGDVELGGLVDAAVEPETGADGGHGAVLLQCRYCGSVRAGGPSCAHSRAVSPVQVGPILRTAGSVLRGGARSEEHTSELQSREK